MVFLKDSHQKYCSLPNRSREFLRVGIGKVALLYPALLVIHYPFPSPSFSSPDVNPNSKIFSFFPLNNRYELELELEISIEVRNFRQFFFRKEKRG